MEKLPLLIHRSITTVRHPTQSRRHIFQTGVSQIWKSRLVSFILMWLSEWYHVYQEVLKIFEGHFFFFLNSFLCGTFKIDCLVVILEKFLYLLLEYLYHLKAKFMSTGSILEQQEKNTDSRTRLPWVTSWLQYLIAVCFGANYLTFLCLWLFANRGDSNLSLELL